MVFPQPCLTVELQSCLDSASLVKMTIWVEILPVAGHIRQEVAEDGSICIELEMCPWDTDAPAIAKFA